MRNSDPRGGSARTGETGSRAEVPGLDADRKSTRTCCGVTLESFMASVRDRSGETVYVMAYECPRCHKVTIE